MPRSTHSSRFGANAEEKPTASEEELEEQRRREREAEAERKRAASALTPTPRRRSPEGARQGPRRRASDRGAFDRSTPGSRSGPRAWRSKRARHAREECVAQASRSFYQLRPASWSDTGSGVGARGSRAARADRRGAPARVPHRPPARGARAARPRAPRARARTGGPPRADPSPTAGRRPSNDQADPESTAATTAARIARRQNRP